MRVLKFRAWDAKNKKFAFNGFHMQPLGEVMLFDLLKGYTLEEECDLQVTQWTGLKDKNGVDIYEGDILKFNYINKEICRPVIFADGAFGFAGTISSCVSLNHYTHLGVEVVGNIYLNSELCN